MQLNAIAPTLLEDWQHRRERLLLSPGELGQYGQMQVQILDFLLSRYHDSPEGGQPARFPLIARAVIEDRRKIVGRHLGGFTSILDVGSQLRARGEALGQNGAWDDVRPAADRFSSDETLPPGATPEPETTPSPDLPAWETIRGAIDRDDQTAALDAIDAALDAQPTLPQEAVDFLAGVIDPAECDPNQEASFALRAAQALGRTENVTAFGAAMRAWRHRVAGGCHDLVTKFLETALCEAAFHEVAAEELRAMLADELAEVRLQATSLLGQIGTLDDVGLLDDLSWLPPQLDEHPGERAALVGAMNELARRGAPDAS